MSGTDAAGQLNFDEAAVVPYWEAASMQRITGNRVFALTIILLASTAPVLHADIITYEFSALIDGRDLLVIKGNTLQWHHLDFAAVGRHGGGNEPTMISSTLNGVPQMENVEWIPDWPEEAPEEIRYEAWSSVFTGLTPALPNTDMTVSLTVLNAWGPLEIYQYPTVDNGYELIIDFNDNDWNSSAWYEGRITIDSAPVPEPASIVMWSLVGAIVLVVRARRKFSSELQ